MLARPAKDVDEALERLGEAAIEWKLDGARVQIHRRDDEVRVFTRTLDDVTARVPEIVEAALALPVRAAVLDGEAIALRADGRPEPFQVTASRFARDQEREVPLDLFLFDVLHADGEDVLDRPAQPSGPRCSPSSFPTRSASHAASWPIPPAQPSSSTTRSRAATRA